MCFLRKGATILIKLTVRPPLVVAKHSMLWMCVIVNYVNRIAGNVVEPFAVSVSCQGVFRYRVPKPDEIGFSSKKTKASVINCSSLLQENHYVLTKISPKVFQAQ